MGIGLPQHAERARRCDEDQRVGLSGIDGGIEALGKLAQEPVLLLRMPIGRLDRTAACSHRVEGAAGRVCPQFSRLRIGVLVNLPGLEVEEFFITRVLQHQGFLAVAHDDPVALADFELLHV
jgi:hypothetical protein